MWWTVETVIFKLFKVIAKKELCMIISDSNVIQMTQITLMSQAFD